MTPQELYRSGELVQAIKALGEELRSNPLDAKRRTFLFELLCFAGEFDRAEKQLDVLSSQNPKAQMGVLMYRSAIHAEKTRRDMFLSGNLPKVDENAAAPGGGTWNDKPFESLSDADPRIGDHLEVFIAGGYTWVPTRYIEQIEIDAPKDLRDLLWAKARIQASPAFRLQDLGEVLLPMIAPLSYLSTDGELQLGRATEWVEAEDGGERPVGHKPMLIDGVEVPLASIRSIEWATAESEPDPETPEAESTDAVA